MKGKIALTVAAMFQMTSMAMAADVNVMSGGAPKQALAILIPQFEKLTGHHVKMTYAVISSLRNKLANGATPDMVLLPMSAIADLVKAKTLKRQGSAPFGTVNIVAIVKEGAALPDISTPEAFRDTLLKARSIVYSTPSATPSGAQMARIVTQFKIADQIRSKVIYRPALDGGVEMVAAGKAEIGVYPSSEVMHVAGVARVGPLPEALQLNLVYGGAVTAANRAAAPSLSFIEFLAQENNKKVWREAGFEPP